MAVQCCQFQTLVLTNEDMALICQHGITGLPPSAAIDKWFLVHENGHEEEVGIAGNTGFTVSRGQNDGVVRLERNSGSSSLEGVYKCVVEANPTQSVTVYLYWPSESFCTEPHVINTKNEPVVLANIVLNNKYSSGHCVLHMCS